jgi:hypothetical protein
VRRIGVVVCVALLAALAAGQARATNECRGLQVCVPVAGPWVVTSPGSAVQFQLACPARFIVAGLDAELSTRGIDIIFQGGLGSPVNPGITTSSSAVFIGRLLAGRAATFRPHIGCVPASGGGERYPTAYRPLPPSRPLAPTMLQYNVAPGVRHYVATCPARRRLLQATHAVGFFTAVPPPAAIVRSVVVLQVVKSGRVRLTVHAGALPGIRAVVQVDLVCA